MTSTISSAAAKMRDRYLAAPLIIDEEYILEYTKRHKETDGMHPIERRAECHAYAMEHITPVIFPDEPFAGTKTKHTRGAVMYCNYSCQFMIKELNHVQQESQDDVIEIGTGGGIKVGHELTKSGEYVKFGKKFLIEKSKLPALKECAEYWSGKCMQDVSDALWKTAYPHADFIQKGWDTVLFTAPHDPSPEGRIVLDFETALTQGFDALIARMEEKIKSFRITTTESAEKVFFWRSGIRVLRAVITWAQHYAEEAERLLKTCAPEDRPRLERIARSCRHCPASPPRDFLEAIQMFWLVYLAGNIEGSHMGYSPGRFDSYMYPFFEADKGKDITQVMEHLEALRVKMTMLEYAASTSWEGLGSGNLFQNMILGGLKEDGSNADNELSMLVVQAAINCRTIQPTLSVWYDPKLSKTFLMKCAECVKTGVGFPAWFNFKVYAAHEMEKSGVSIKTVRKYAAIGGCTEPTMAGMSYGIVQPGFINHMKLFELAMNGGKDPRTGTVLYETPIPKTYDELLARYKEQMAVAIQRWQEYWSYVMAAHRITCGLIYCSCLVKDCIERGKSMDDGGALINGTPTTLSTGLVNVANALAAVKLLQDEHIPLDTVRTATAANWEGYAELKQKCIDAPKWGNDDDRVDDVFVDLWDEYCATVANGTNFLGEKYDPSMLAISTHAPFGRVCLATPDGRTAGETLADGVTSPFYGTDKHGPFAVLLSAKKVDHTLIRGGLHNMKFHPSALRGDEGSEKLLSLIATYFEGNAFQIQFNVVDAETLRQAQQHPEQYRDLIVRVAGFSAFFVELSKPIQDEVIKRTEFTLN